MTLHWPDNISTDIFLRDYWQKQPLLIRNAFPDKIDLITIEELAGLACEEDVESRLILFDMEKQQWQLEHGPIEEKRFSTLPSSHWTILVQDVDKHVPAAADFIKHFEFIPKWRIDDLMISYAADQGSVGPHTDSYDVFLIQLSGERLWKISDTLYTDQDLLENSDVKILKQFQADHEWLLKPGDMLYLPPQVAHWGIAQGDCMTGSVGFISPGSKELFQSWSEYMVDQINEDRHYQDPGLTLADNPNRVEQAAIQKISAMLKETIATDSFNLTRWFGQMISESKPHLHIESTMDDPLDIDSVADSLAVTDYYRHPYLRAFFTEWNQEIIMLFVNGESFELPMSEKAFVHILCEQTSYPAGTFSYWFDNRDCLECLVTMINHGYVLKDESE